MANAQIEPTIVVNIHPAQRFLATRSVLPLCSVLFLSASRNCMRIMARRRVLSAGPTGDLPLDRLMVKSGGSTRFVRVTDIDWIEAAGVYTNLHIGGKELLYRAALNELAERLDPIRFVRVHRSAIVNIESILRLKPISHGEFEAILKDGSRSRISRTYRSQLEKRLGQSLWSAPRCETGRLAYEVGYESISQFSREYSRFFGQPPIRDIKALRDSKVVPIIHTCERRTADKASSRLRWPVERAGGKAQSVSGRFADRTAGDVAAVYLRKVLVMRIDHELPEVFRSRRPVRVMVVGAGGSGSAIVLGLPYLHQAMRVWGHSHGLEVTVVDPDIVSRTNCVRQPFSVSDIGLNKATALVNRINLFWGLEWQAEGVPFAAKMLREYHDVKVDLLIGCVDTCAARRYIAEALSEHGVRTSYWLDLGNNAASGQYVLGQPINAANRRKAARLRTVSELYPEIVDADAGEDELPSCSAIEALERQEPYTNQTLAASALAMLARLLRYGRIAYHGGFYNAHLRHRRLLRLPRPLRHAEFGARRVGPMRPGHIAVKTDSPNGFFEVIDASFEQTFVQRTAPHSSGRVDFR